jgi:hypothetical protein
MEGEIRRVLLRRFPYGPFYRVTDEKSSFWQQVVWEYHFSAPGNVDGAWLQRDWRGVSAPPVAQR